jgi:hypothetical protein
LVHKKERQKVNHPINPKDAAFRVGPHKHFTYLGEVLASGVENLERKESRTLGAQMQKCHVQRFNSQAVFIIPWYVGNDIFASELLECAALLSGFGNLPFM